METGRFICGQNNFYKFNIFRALFLILLLGLFISGCEEEKKQVNSTVAAEASTENPTTSIIIVIDLNTEEQNSNFVGSVVGTISDISWISITVRVSDSAQTVVTEILLKETIAGSGIWEGELAGLPISTDLEFEANAFNAEGKIIFTDTLIKSFDSASTQSFGSQSDIIFEMESVDNGIETVNPVISSIVIAEEVEINSVDNPITIKIVFETEVEYQLEVNNGAISTPLTGSHDPGSELNIKYNAPSEAGVDKLNIWVNAPGSSDKAGSVFPINVVSSLRPVEVGVLFGPAITGMQLLRGVDYLMVTVSTEPVTGLSYKWSGTGDFSNISGNDNPLIIESFNNSQFGEINVEVMDSNGLKAELTKTIGSGDFPYLMEFPDPTESPDPVNDIPEGTVLDQESNLLWMSTEKTKKMRWLESIAYCGEILNHGGHSDWRLPTLTELEDAYIKNDIFSTYPRSGSWASLEYKFNKRKAWFLRRNSKFKRIGNKKRRHAVHCVRNWE